MRAFIVLWILLLALPKAFAEEGQKDFIESLVEGHQDEVRSRFDQSITLTFFDADILQALGGRRKGKLVIDVFKGIWNLPDEVVVSVFICHELGHILGNVSIGEALEGTGGSTHFDPLDNVEGEADYFSGKCIRNTWDALGPIDLLAVARNALELIYKEEIDEGRAHQREFKGINPGYPDKDCRLLSVKAGLMGWPRPKCWYNPADLDTEDIF